MQRCFRLEGVPHRLLVDLQDLGDPASQGLPPGPCRQPLLRTPACHLPVHHPRRHAAAVQRDCPRGLPGVDFGRSIATLSNAVRSCPAVLTGGVFSGRILAQSSSDVNADGRTCLTVPSSRPEPDGHQTVASAHGIGYGVAGTLVSGPQVHPWPVCPVLCKVGTSKATEPVDRAEEGG